MIRWLSRLLWPTDDPTLSIPSAPPKATSHATTKEHAWALAVQGKRAQQKREAAKFKLEAGRRRADHKPADVVPIRRVVKGGRA